MQEFEGPSPEDMAFSGPKENGQSPADLFERFIKTDPEVFSPKVKIVDFEKENFFVISNSKEDGVYTRTYFAQVRQQAQKTEGEDQNVDEELTFHETARARIESNHMISFTKTGRPTSAWNELESLAFTSEFREDKTQFDLDYSLFDVKEDDLVDSRQEGSYLNVIYDPEGNLFFVALRHKDLPHGARFTSSYFMADSDNVEAMEEIRQAAEQERTLEASGIKLGVAYSPDRENFVFTMYNKQGEADYTVIVPVHVNVAEIMEETGALNILRNPTQLSKGIPGQGIGDTDWRYKSFSQLTGIKLASARIQLRPEVPLVFPNARF